MQQPFAFISKNCFNMKYNSKLRNTKCRLALLHHVSRGNTFVKLVDNSVPYKWQTMELAYKIFPSKFLYM